MEHSLLLQVQGFSPQSLKIARAFCSSLLCLHRVRSMTDFALKTKV